MSDMPLASATKPVASRWARASTRARARVAVTFGDTKLGRLVGAVRADLRRWWLVAARPPSMRTWIRTLRPVVDQVPEGSSTLRRLWMADNYVTGSLMRGLSVAVFLVAGGLAWLSCHPLRRWTAIVLAVAVAVEFVMAWSH